MVSIYRAYLRQTEPISPPPSKSSCISIQSVRHNIVPVFFAQLFSLSGPEAFNIIMPVRVGPAWPLGGATFDIFLRWPSWIVHYISFLR